eukprot:6477918-Amphidinium_carterae.1
MEKDTAKKVARDTVLQDAAAKFESLPGHVLIGLLSASSPASSSTSRTEVETRNAVHERILAPYESSLKELGYDFRRRNDGKSRARGRSSRSSSKSTGKGAGKRGRKGKSRDKKGNKSGSRSRQSSRKSASNKGSRGRSPPAKGSSPNGKGNGKGKGKDKSKGKEQSKGRGTGRGNIIGVERRKGAGRSVRFRQ